MIRRRKRRPCQRLASALVSAVSVSASVASAVAKAAPQFAAAFIAVAAAVSATRSAKRATASKSPVSDTNPVSATELTRSESFKQTAKSQNHPRPLVSESDAPLGIPLRNQYQIQEGGEWSEIGSG
jgi:hypothetical protein